MMESPVYCRACGHTFDRGYDGGDGSEPIRIACPECGAFGTVEPDSGRVGDSGDTVFGEELVPDDAAPSGERSSANG